MHKQRSRALLRPAPVDSIMDFFYEDTLLISGCALGAYNIIFRNIMQKLGKSHFEGVNDEIVTNPIHESHKTPRSHPESTESHCSKAKKITKIIHNTIVFYED